MDKKITGVILFVGLLALAGVGNAVTLQNPLNVNTFCELLTNIVKAVAGLIGVISTIMITIAGIMYLTSAGIPERTNKAKTAFIYAIVGFVIAVSASTIVDLIKSVINASGGGC
ncbi:MAG: TrbC/VirB2 family protein [Candidatus Staskawiczbacteria bacterium]|nr:TrbC/VirB2 family protein [Candidatus Staskawiczbacteria bacterium]